VVISPRDSRGSAATPGAGAKERIPFTHLITLIALEAALAAEQVKLPRGSGVDAAAAVYCEAEKSCRS
jgi:hypothetical protein